MREIVVVEGILIQAVPTRVSVVKISLAEELSVGNICELVRHLDADLHRLDFVFPLIFVRPPDAGAFALASSQNPWTPNWVFAESETTETANRLRRAGIIEVDRISAAGFQRCGKVDEYRARVAFVLEW